MSPAVPDDPAEPAVPNDPAEPDGPKPDLDPDPIEVERVLAANRRFYEAFESSDMSALAAAWEHSDRVVCTHPGWASLRGWDDVQASWQAILRGGGAPQFVLTAEHVTVVGAVAWVTLDENLLGAGGASGTVAALNVLVRGEDGAWRMVAHHGSSVVPRSG